MKLLKTLKGDGTLRARGVEYSVSYVIEAFGDANQRTADGSIEGLDVGNIFDIQTSGQATLEMSDGVVLDITPLDGIINTLKFTVNSRLPGL